MKEEEREKKIKKLKEISKKDRKEIEEAQSLIKGTEDIIKEEPIKEEVKVPELEEAEISELVREPSRDYAAEEEEAREEARERETRLEETVEREAEERPVGEREAEQQAQYNIFKQEFQGQRTEDIYNSVRGVYQRMQETGEAPSPEEMNRVNAAMYEAHRRESGMISEEVSQKLVLTERMGSWISRMYRH